MHDVREYLGQAAGAVSFAAYLLYIISTLRGKTRPSRSTWWILALVGSLIFLTSYSVGARESIWIMGSYVAGPLIIAVLSLHPRYGYGERLMPLDIGCLVWAGICALIWLLFNSPLIAFMGSIVLDAIGLIPTAQKAYHEPDKEDPLAWSIEMVASILNAVGITAWFVTRDLTWIYALYLLAGNGTIVILLLFRSAKARRESRITVAGH